jgi:hypothetical protein
MLERFENIPDMLELDHLTVSGDVTFGKNVTLKVITGASECWDLETLEGVCQYIPRSLGPSKSDIEFVLVYSGTSEQGTLWGQRFCPL